MTRRCPQCKQDVEVRDNQTYVPHFRPGVAPPCPGSNTTILPAPATPLFDEE